MGNIDLAAFMDNAPIATDEGYFVSEKHMRMAEIIRNYDPNLDIEFIPEGRREEGDKPFRVVHTDPRFGNRYVVCYADDLDGPLLERIVKMDAQRNGNILSDIDAHNQAVRLVMQKKHQEQMDEAHDLAAHILKSPKSTYRHDGVVYQ